jgi:hypothetical protein
MGCSFLKDAGRTIHDAATILCRLFAEENQKELAGITPQQFCAAEENLRPFIDEALKAKQTAGGTALSQ